MGCRINCPRQLASDKDNKAFPEQINFQDNNHAIKLNIIFRTDCSRRFKGPEGDRKFWGSNANTWLY